MNYFRKLSISAIGILLLTSVNSMPLIVAHRGASADAPENTLPAFELAWEQGADAIEGDFHLTTDGHIVCIHDYDTKKTSGVNITVAKASLEELVSLDVGKWFDESYSGTRIPILPEVLETVPEGKQIFIEVKCGPEIIPALRRDLEMSDLDLNQVTIISFNAGLIHDLKLWMPELKANWLTGFETGLNGQLKPSSEILLSTLELINADGLGSTAHNALRKQDIRALTKGGFAYHAWTIDDPEKAQQFIRMGAQSITTNVPGFMKQALGQ